VVGVATCALTGLLVSPISWDHHWAWMLLAAPLLVYYGLRANGSARWLWLGLAALVTALFWAWPTSLWSETQATDPFGWTWGLIWAPPNGLHREYRWHGLQLLVGNTYVLTGIALLLVLVVVALMRSRRPQHASIDAGRLAGDDRRTPAGIRHNG
jgi:alpha-1,2-mannosyltransferase